MVKVKALKAFSYSPDGIAVIEVQKGDAELPESFVEIAVGEGWIASPKKGGSAKSAENGGGETPPPQDPPADPPPQDPPAD